MGVFDGVCLAHKGESLAKISYKKLVLVLRVMLRNIAL